MNEEQERFSKFCAELELLSKKHGVLLSIVGGVHILEKDEVNKIHSVDYSNDSTSGDLEYQINWKRET